MRGFGWFAAMAGFLCFVVTEITVVPSSAAGYLIYLPGRDNIGAKRIDLNIPRASFLINQLQYLCRMGGTSEES